MAVASALILSGLLDWAVGAPVLGCGLLRLMGLAVGLTICVRETGRIPRKPRNHRRRALIEQATEVAS
jgi:hypothetical protein